MFSVPGVEKLRVTSRDGAELTAYVAGASGPVLVLASGLGGPFSAWRYQIAHFSKRFRILSWDYRGLFESRLPAAHSPVDVATQAADLDLLLDRIGAERAVVVGWSMGVQVALEYHASFPHRTSHLVLINGTAGRPFASLPLPGTAVLMPPLLRRVQRFGDTGTALLKRAAEARTGISVLQTLSSLATELAPDVAAELFGEFSRIDLGTYLRTLQALGEHDRHDLLGQVNVPSLVIAGARDRFTPMRLSELMAREIRNAELVVVPKGTHYSATEFPDFVNRHIEAFLARNGHGVAA
jgi:pimeloyl-ACP methyl ester carboxylesterase